MNEVDLPEWVIDSEENSITIAIGDFDDSQSNLKVTIEDVCRYFAQEARSMSGIRTLAGHSGDWRPIDELAQFCLDYFKGTNIAELRKISRKFGLIPKF